jgi:hypothetical protein
MAWSTKSFKYYPLLINCSLYRQKMLVIFQKVLTTTILCWAVVTMKEASSKLGVLLNFSPISFHDLLHATHDGFRF